MELHVDLFVDQSLRVGMEVGADLGDRHVDGLGFFGQKDGCNRRNLMYLGLWVLLLGK